MSIRNDDIYFDWKRIKSFKSRPTLQGVTPSYPTRLYMNDFCINPFNRHFYVVGSELADLNEDSVQNFLWVVYRSKDEGKNWEIVDSSPLDDHKFDNVNNNHGEPSCYSQAKCIAFDSSGSVYVCGTVSTGSLYGIAIVRKSLTGDDGSWYYGDAYGDANGAGYCYPSIAVDNNDHVYVVMSDYGHDTRIIRRSMSHGESGSFITVSSSEGGDNDGFNFVKFVNSGSGVLFFGGQIKINNVNSASLQICTNLPATSSNIYTVCTTGTIGFAEGGFQSVEYNTNTNTFYAIASHLISPTPSVFSSSEGLIWSNIENSWDEPPSIYNKLYNPKSIATSRDGKSVFYARNCSLGSVGEYSDTLTSHTSGSWFALSEDFGKYNSFFAPSFQMLYNNSETGDFYEVFDISKIVVDVNDDIYVLGNSSPHDFPRYHYMQPE